MVKQFANIKYKLSHSDNFDEFMKQLGVGLVTRKMGNSVSPTVELNVSDDGTYTLKSSSTFKNTVTTFRLGEEFEEETPDGRKVKSTVTQEGEDTLVHVQRGEKESKIVRQWSPEELKMTLSVGDVVCTRLYKLVQ